ncbi:MAG TPA: hypothetical protein VMY39_07745, partial [Planctomycetota bacterium]|nr:hypothetical protein [Planctomycetota bacterium]
RCHSQSHFTLHLQKRGEQDARQIGAVYNAYAAPHFVPGKSPRILAFEGRSLYLLNWTLFDTAGREVGLPIDASRKAVGTDTPAIATDRVAVPVYGLIKEYWKTGQKPWGIWIVVADLSGDTPVVTEAALFDVHHYETQKNFLDYPSIDLDFSPDGNRLVMSKFEHLGTAFYEIDASGASAPRELFTDKQAWAPKWTPDGKGVVYFRKHPDPVKWNRLQAVLWRPDGDGPKPVAEFPGQVRRSGEVLRRLPDGRMRLAAFADDGIRIIDMNADGSDPAERHLSRDMLGRQMALAYFELRFNRNRKVNQYQAPWEVMKHFYKMEQPKDVAREDLVARALELAWKENTAW